MMMMTRLMPEATLLSCPTLRMASPSEPPCCSLPAAASKFGSVQHSRGAMCQKYVLHPTHVTPTCLTFDNGCWHIGRLLHLLQTTHSQLQLLYLLHQFFSLLCSIHLSHCSFTSDIHIEVSARGAPSDCPLPSLPTQCHRQK